jgi:hypothetical protein
VFSGQNDRHDTIGPVRKQFVVTGAGLFSSDAPRFSISTLAAEGPDDAVAPAFPSQAASDRTAAMIAAVVAMRIMRTSSWGPRDVVQTRRLYKRPFRSRGVYGCSTCVAAIQRFAGAPIIVARRPRSACRVDACPMLNKITTQGGANLLLSLQSHGARSCYTASSEGAARMVAGWATGACSGLLAGVFRSILVQIAPLSAGKPRL